MIRSFRKNKSSTNCGSWLWRLCLHLRILIKQETMRYLAWRAQLPFFMQPSFDTPWIFKFSCAGSRLRNLWSLQGFITSTVCFVRVISKEWTLRNTENAWLETKLLYWTKLLQIAGISFTESFTMTAMLFYQFHMNMSSKLRYWPHKLDIRIKLCNPSSWLATDATQYLFSGWYYFAVITDLRNG